LEKLIFITNKQTDKQTNRQTDKVTFSTGLLGIQIEDMARTNREENSSFLCLTGINK
jgi:hypothetical protein